MILKYNKKGISRYIHIHTLSIIEIDNEKSNLHELLCVIAIQVCFVQNNEHILRYLS